MIVKLTLLSTISEHHPMMKDKVILGYSRDEVELGHPMLIWYAHGNDSRYIRTSRVDRITEVGEKTGPDQPIQFYKVVTTGNSVYRVDDMDVKILQESKEI